MNEWMNEWMNKWINNVVAIKDRNDTYISESACRDSNPPVLAGNLPFLGIVSVLQFSLQNLPFFVFFEKESNLSYLFSEIE